MTPKLLFPRFFLPAILLLMCGCSPRDQFLYGKWQSQSNGTTITTTLKSDHTGEMDVHQAAGFLNNELAMQAPCTWEYENNILTITTASGVIVNGQATTRSAPEKIFITIVSNTPPIMTIKTSQGAFGEWDYLGAQ